MIQEWNNFRLHLNAAFSTMSDAEGEELLLLLQHTKEQWDARQAARERLSMPSADTLAESDDEPVSGVSWDKVKGKWRVCISHRREKRGFGRFDTLGEANAQARGVRTVVEVTGRLPQAGWRVKGGSTEE